MDPPFPINPWRRSSSTCSRHYTASCARGSETVCIMAICICSMVLRAVSAETSVVRVSARFCMQLAADISALLFFFSERICVNNARQRVSKTADRFLSLSLSNTHICKCRFYTVPQEPPIPGPPQARGRGRLPRLPPPKGPSVYWPYDC